METFSALLALCAGNSTVNSLMRSFDIFSDLRLNERLSKQSRRRWFETQSLSLWPHCNGIFLPQHQKVIAAPIPAWYSHRVWLLQHWTLHSWGLFRIGNIWYWPCANQALPQCSWGCEIRTPPFSLVPTFQQHISWFLTTCVCYWFKWFTLCDLVDFTYILQGYIAGTSVQWSNPDEHSQLDSMDSLQML